MPRTRNIVALVAGTLVIATGALTSGSSGADEPDNIEVPDLTDPAQREAFVESFADGYFSEPQGSVTNQP